ncbi:MAG: serine/threonine-protein phosphatase [Muribaculaceae bacterium]|nr:serine/threonine-protein phosphatase [Muribaculaceae bacterium]
MDILLNQAHSFILMGQRSNQEDCRYPDTDQPRADQRFFIVCDGVGGEACGEVASHTVCQAMSQELSHHDWKQDLTNTEFGRALDAAYNALDAKAAGREQMATTLTLAAFHGGGMTLAHIGDSRIYHIRPAEGIIYRSDDHSMVNTLVHNGLLTPEQASVDPRRNIITRYMSPTAADQTRCMATVLHTADVLPHDVVLLCSDGVLQNIDDEQLLDMVSSASNDRDILEHIKDRCSNNLDNCTATMIRIGQVNGCLDSPSRPADATAHDTAVVNHNEVGVVNIASNHRPASRSLSAALRRMLHWN